MRPTSAVLLCLLLLGACATGSGPPLPITTSSLTDDYELAHGLTKGAVFSGGIDREQVIRIITLDRAAIDARNATITDPSDPARQRAQDAIAALAQYAASVGAAVPVGLPGVSRSGAN